MQTRDDLSSSWPSILYRLVGWLVGWIFMASQLLGYFFTEDDFYFISLLVEYSWKGSLDIWWSQRFCWCFGYSRVNVLFPGEVYGPISLMGFGRLCYYDQLLRIDLACFGGFFFTLLKALRVWEKCLHSVNVSSCMAFRRNILVEVLVLVWRRELI